ncbi:MAG: nucleotidyltransferase domain-containing protein [Elusimicrobia bacterium]|nr:nucleotidyltransferase domain-containing protein [Elusimicrobiota bacterium]
MISLKSVITRKILNYFFLNPQEDLYVNEIERKLHLDKRNLIKKIRELESQGFLNHEARGNLKLYSINQNHPLYAEYRKIVLSTVGFEDQLKTILKTRKDIQEAYLYGSYPQNAMDSSSDIDLLIVSKGSAISLQKSLSPLQKEIQREINVINMDEQEFKRRIQKKDSFLSQVLKQKHIKLI